VKAMVAHAAARPRNLPPGWRWTALSDLGPLTDGDWILNQDYAESGIRLLQVGDIGDGEFRDRSSRFVSEQTARDLKCTLLESGDVLISRMPDPLGRACLLPDLGYQCITAVDVSIWRPVETRADREFLTYYLASSEWLSLAASKASGATRPRISRKVLETLPVPLPPLPEQKRIAAALRAQLDAAARMRAAATRTTSALSALYEARLRDILSSVRDSACPRVVLGSVITPRNDIIHPRDNTSGRGIFVGLEHIESGTGRRVGSEQIDKAALTGRKARFHPGDIVYGYLRPYLNKVWLADFEGLCSVDQYVYVVDQGQADVEYVAWFMRSPLFLSQAPVASGPGQLPRIRLDEIARVELALPPLPEQRRIAAVLREQLDSATHLRAAAEGQAVDIGRLTAAVLRSAFLEGSGCLA